MELKGTAAEIKKNTISEKLNLILTENPVLRYITFSVLYFAQGIPEGITMAAIPAWLAMNGKTPMEIAGYTAVVLIPWSFKLIIAPLMDRFTILSMGRKRPWVIFGQAGLIISFLAIGLVPDPLNNLNALMIAGFIISLFGAFQDVSTDGMAIDVIPPDEQARANGLMWGSKVIGFSLSFVVGTTLINTLGFSAAVPFMSIGVAFIILAPIFFRERSGEKLMPWSKGKPSENSKNTQSKSWPQIFKGLYKVVILPTSLLLILAVFIKALIVNIMDTSFTILIIQDLNWTNTSFSQISSITSVIGGICGMLVGGTLVDIYGEKKMLSIYFSVLMILIGTIGFSQNYWENDNLIFAFYLIFALLSTFITISILSAAMKLCWKTVAATQFTLYMAVNNMGSAAGAGLTGKLKEYMSWPNIFLSIALVPLLIIIIIQFIDFSKHRKTIDNF